MPIVKLHAIGREHQVSHVVAGLPLSLDGTEGEWCLEVRKAGSALADRLGAELAFVDERMTSVRARAVIRSMGMRKKARQSRKKVDEVAAQLILQAWLDGVERGK